MGMCGPYNSILGDDIEAIIERFRSGVFTPLKVSNDSKILIQGVVIDLGAKRTIQAISKII